MDWWKKIWPWGTKDLPDTPYWKAYQAHFMEQPTRSTLIRDLRFVVLDTETTGLDPQNDTILSIGAVAVRDQQIWIGDRFEAFLPQESNQVVNDQEAVAVHGILGKHGNQQQATAEILIDFLAYLKGSIFVAQHAAFDYGILQAAYRKELQGHLLNATIDTAHLARRLDDPSRSSHMNPAKAKQYGLDQLCQRFNIPIEARHTASGDALLTAILLVKLLSRLETRGIKHWGELQR
ncbi:MAG: 3'-5' exonuclease [Bacteroidota bacterium]